MPAALTRDDVARVAALAQLELDQAEVEMFTRQLGEILAYADALLKVDTTGVTPTASVLTRHPSDRMDEVQPSLENAAALANAPDAAVGAGLFKVPRIIG